MRHRPLVGSLVAAAAALAALTSCSSTPSQDGPPSAGSPSATGSTDAPEAPPKPSLTLSVPARRVPLQSTVHVGVENGDLATVHVRGERLGKMGAAEKRVVALPGGRQGDEWSSPSPLEPSTRYTVTARLSDGTTLTKKFTSQRVDLAHQTYPTLYPNGGSYGVGQPVVVRFDVPIQDRASIEKSLSVTTTPAQVGSWHWVSSQEVRWRPKVYWKPGTRVRVSAQVNSVPAGGGVFGQFDQASSFRIDPVAKLIRVNMDTHELSAYQNGKLIRRFGISTGREPEFATRSGVKVIMSKERTHRMSSGTIGIDPNSGEGYDLVVDYAMRLTTSGEFFHAAPWNSAYFGNSNQSHGCTGMSDSDAAWLYGWADLGTPAEYRGTDKWMTVDNGYGDWSESYREYRKGSAL